MCHGITIVSIHSNKVRTLELATWIEKTFNGKDIQPSKIYGGTELIKEMIVVSQSKNEIQLMDPKNYSIFNIRKPRLLSASLKTVKTVTLDDYLFLIPEPTL